MKIYICLIALLVTIPAFGAGCEAALGEWKWFNGGTATVVANQSLLWNGKPAGKWECTNAARNTVTLRWTAGFVDTLTVSGDRMSGKNLQGITVSGTRTKPAAPHK